MRLVNVLAQPVVFPKLFAGSGTTTVSSALAGQPIQNLTLPCGDYVAYWNGKIMNEGREAPSGTYGVEIFVDGTKQSGTPKIFHSK